MTDLNTAHKIKDRSKLFHIVEDDVATTVTIKYGTRLKENFVTKPCVTYGDNFIEMQIQNTLSDIP